LGNIKSNKEKLGIAFKWVVRVSKQAEKIAPKLVVPRTRLPWNPPSIKYQTPIDFNPELRKQIDDTYNRIATAESMEPKATDIYSKLIHLLYCPSPVGPDAALGILVDASITRL
jgi:hypothetical protein